MSQNTPFGFASLVPGFDFLQNIAKGAGQGMPQMPNISSWVAPTLNIEELDKRISELKAVHFWLDQNGKALAATIQALEVQKMTLATLQGMNFSMGEVADALKLKETDPVAAGVKKVSETAAAVAEAAEARRKSAAKKAAGSKAPAGTGAPAAPAAGPVDPMQWWGALTEQFQQIAAGALKEAQKAAPGLAASAVVEPPRAGAKVAARKAAAPKAAPRKQAPRKKKD